MPCYTIREVSVLFQIKNVDLLKRAVEKAGHTITEQLSTGISIRDKFGNRCFIDLVQGQINGRNMDEKQLTSFSNQIKRAYSEMVIDELAKKQHWLKKNMGKGQFQLQRF
jgi:hypothetical protein